MNHKNYLLIRYGYNDYYTVLRFKTVQFDTVIIYFLDQHYIKVEKI